MKSRPSTLAILTLYAVLATLGLSYFFLREIASQLTSFQTPSEKQSSRHLAIKPPNGTNYYTTSKTKQKRKRSPQSAPSAQSIQRPKFPIMTHMVTHGHARTATTLLFNMVGVSYFLYLLEYNPKEALRMTLEYRKKDNGSGAKFLRHAKKPYVIKTHVDLGDFLGDDTLVFTTAMDKEEASETESRLSNDGHAVAFVQDMETLKEIGVPGLVKEYIAGFGLPSKYEDDLLEYFTNWEILRQCCGLQMSSKWRNDLYPENLKSKSTPHHPTCGTYDIDAVEQAFMNTSLFSLIDQYPNVKPLNKPSLKDDDLNGTYCSNYNNLVHTKGLNFFGVEGRPVRSELDGVIKQQFKLGISNLDPEFTYLFDTTYEKLWRRTDEEKVEWVKAVLLARGDPADEKEMKLWVSSALAAEEVASEGNEESESGEYNNEINENEMHVVDQQYALPTKDLSFDNTHAIFLISFGSEAAESTLVERCILSLRRRGAWSGYIVVLTDAPRERYQNVWDENVIVMHPFEKHYNSEKGEPLEFKKKNLSLKFKRFKTLILDYMDSDPRLDSVDLVYYLDIDIMAGNTLNGLFGGVEQKYGILQPNEVLDKDWKSRMYFFTPLSKEWPLQGGTFIVERRTSKHCLDLWRLEIESQHESERDQVALANVYNRIASGEEMKCELIPMENENYLKLPKPKTIEKIARSKEYPNLIHISNSVFANWIEEGEQNELIYDVLQLSEEEKMSGKFGKMIIHAKDIK